MHFSYWQFAVGVCLTLPSLAVGYQDNLGPTNDRPKPPVVRQQPLFQTVAIEQNFFNKEVSYRVKIEAGSIQPDTSYKLTLTVQNPFPLDIKFNRVQSSCSCGKFGTEAAIIPANGSIEIPITFKTHKSSETGKFGFQVTCFDNEEGKLEFVLFSELASNLHIKERASFEIKSEQQTFRIPISVTAPIEISELQIELDDSLAKLDATLIKDGGDHFLELLISPNDFIGKYLTGGIRVISPRHELSSHCDILISRLGLLRISPQVARFRWSEKEQRFAANLLMRVADNEQAGQRLLTTDNHRLSVSAGDVGFRVQQQKLADGIYRIQLIAPDKPYESLRELRSLKCQTQVQSDTIAETITATWEQK